MSLAELIRGMAAAGAPSEAIALAVEAVERAQGEVAAKRVVERDRKRRQRERARDSHGTVTGQSADTPFLSPPSPEPPSTTNLSCDPPIVPPSSQLPLAKPDDVSAAFDLWNETAKLCGLPRAKALDPTRRRAIRQRLETGGLELWAEAMEAVKRSAFLRGLRTGNDGRVFKADLTFVCQAKSYQRLVDGGYGDDAPPPAARDGPAAIVTDAERARRLRHYRDTGEWRDAWGDKPERAAA